MIAHMAIKALCGPIDPCLHTRDFFLAALAQIPLLNEAGKRHPRFKTFAHHMI